MAALDRPAWRPSLQRGSEAGYRAGLCCTPGGRRLSRNQPAGRTIDVTFTPADPALEGRIDAAYRAKYAGDFNLGSMISTRAQAAGVEVTPHD